MKQNIELHTNRASVSTTIEHLTNCDKSFTTPLSSRVDIDEYSLKLIKNSTRFEAWHGKRLVGLVAIYCNCTEKKVAYVSNVSIDPLFHRQGIARRLINNCFQYLIEDGFNTIQLEVANDNSSAMQLYEKLGFTIFDKSDESTIMYAELTKENKMNTRRDYNTEISDVDEHKYAYSFDFDVIHPFMIRSFEPFFIDGNLLELGSFKGDFTRRLVERFEHVTCLEASDKAIDIAKSKLGSKATFIHSTFESADLDEKYDNIVFTHVLEHLDDPVKVLKRINDEWLTENGRLFLVCPNANAPSRQIAVKMGLISHNAAVTPAEAEHGHRCTYTLDTLERDATKAGLKVVHRSGIFFKALANFQWDKLLETDIITPEYLEGCYKLGQQYPDLCSSVFLMCEKG